MDNEIATKLALRQELINELTKSTGNPKLAEYCVNRLTMHDTDLLARAALVFAADDLRAVSL